MRGKYMMCALLRSALPDCVCCVPAMPAVPAGQQGNRHAKSQQSRSSTHRISREQHYRRYPCRLTTQGGRHGRCGARSCAVQAQGSAERRQGHVSEVHGSHALSFFYLFRCCGGRRRVNDGGRQSAVRQSLRQGRWACLRAGACCAGRPCTSNTRNLNLASRSEGLHCFDEVIYRMAGLYSCKLGMLPSANQNGNCCQIISGRKSLEQWEKVEGGCIESLQVRACIIASYTDEQLEEEGEWRCLAAAKGGSGVQQAQRQDAPIQLCRQHNAALRLCPCQAQCRCLQPRPLLVCQPTNQPPSLRCRSLQDGRQRSCQVGAGRRNGLPLLLAKRQAGH